MSQRIYSFCDHYRILKTSSPVPHSVVEMMSRDLPSWSIERLKCAGIMEMNMMIVALKFVVFYSRFNGKANSFQYIGSCKQIRLFFDRFWEIRGNFEVPSKYQENGIWLDLRALMLKLSLDIKSLVGIQVNRRGQKFACHMRAPHKTLIPRT